MKEVEIRLIKPNPWQSRENYDRENIRQLAKEIEEQGLWEGSLRARQVDGHYELVFGHRRLEALKHLGYKLVNLEVVKVDDAQMALQSLIENLQRQGLSDIEKAKGIKRLLQFGAAAPSSKKVAELLGYSVHSIDEFLRLADLDATTQKAASDAGLSRTAIRTADSIGGPQFIRVAARHKLNRDDLDELQKELNRAPEPAQRVIRDQLRSGKITKPEQVRRAATKASVQRVKKDKPHLDEVLKKWTPGITYWRQELKAIQPFAKHIGESDSVAARGFRDEVKRLIADLEKLL